MKLLKKFAAAAVSVVLILAALPAVPAFAETDLQTVSVNSVDFDFGRLPDNDELLAGYLQKQMYGGISLYGTTAGDRLDGIGKAIYDYLKLNIETVAAGGLDSTVFGFDLSVFSDDDINIFIRDFNTNINKILNCLLTDCPYELYWFDKTQGYRVDNETVNTRLDFKFTVADTYKGEGKYAVDTAKTGAVTSAIANATEIVEENYGKSDLEKLNAYRAEICGLVSYDFEAANGGIAYGDPWQLIYVFDNDPETNVVCEGYAKAFQYLCDLSEFAGYVVCNTVTGTMDGGTGAGRHMWNIVEYGGSNYLVDVTNCDEGAIGADAGLFMVGASQHPDNRTYIFNVNSTEVTYIYDEKMYDLICDGYPILSDSSPIVDIPIKSIEVADISIIENTNGYITSDYIPETETQSPEYYKYDYMPEFTVTLNDDTVLYSEWGSIIYNGEYYYLDCHDDQSYENQWTVGTHTVSADLLGFETSFDVTITASPVESVEVSDISIIEGTHGYTSEDGSYYYNDINPSFTVKLKDGRVFTSEYGAVIIDGEWSGLNVDISKQYKEPWTAGNTYEVDCEILGASGTFNVTIKETVIDSLEISDISLIKDVDSYDNGFYEYYRIIPTYTLKFKDGTQKTVNNNTCVIIDGDYCYLDTDDKQEENPFEVGNTYELTGKFGTLTDTFNVTVIENPVTGVEIVKAPDRTDYYVGDYLNLKGAVLRVHFNDDTYEDVKINTPTDTEEHSYYLNKLKASYYIDYVEPFTEAGKQQTKSKFLGNIFECEVDVKENNWESIEVKNGTDKSLIITAVKPDGTTEDMRILGFDCRGGGEEEGLETRDGYIFTDKGTFMGRLYCNSLNDTYKIEINELCSNIFKDSGLIKIWDYLAYSEINYNYIALITEKHFNGEITAENIDRLITVASYLDKDFGLDVCTEKTVDGEKIRELLSKNFAVNDVDLSLSEYYDGETDTYLWTEKHYYFAEPQIIDTEVNYNNEAWNVKLTAADETNMYLKLDDNLRVISMTYGCTVGDLDGDEAVTESDAIYLLMYTFFPEDYPIEQPCDFDGDGDITEADANLNGDIFKLTLKAKQASSQEQSVSVSVEYKSGTTVVGSNSSSVKIKAVCKNHTYGEYSKVNDSQHKHVCTVCEYEEKVNHTWNSGSVTKAATCKETGVKTYTCTACKATKTETIAKNNSHTWGNWNTTKQPTCTTPGTATKTCSTCGKTENQTINATGHSMGAWSQSKAPTCTANGEEKRGCSRCNHTETRTVKALGHSFSNPTVTKQPTCTETGVETGKCTRCGQTTTNTIKAKGHKFGEWTDTKAATCTEGGVQERKCTVCDTVETRNTEALGHDFENPTIVKEPSISNTGLKEGKCKRCGETTSEIIPCSVKDDTTGTLFEANEGVFTAGTELKVEEIKKDNPTFESAKNILKDVCNEFILYDITAVLNGAKVQPNGEVTVTFNIPDGFGNDVEVFFVSDDGIYEKLESEVNEDGKTITAKLNHFSNYAVCKVSDNKAEISTDKAEPEISTDKTENAKNNNVLYLIIAALAIAVIVGVTVFIMKKKKQI